MVNHPNRNRWTEIGTFGNHFQLRQKRDEMYCEVRTRRVQPQGGPEHVQMEIEIAKNGDKRTMRQWFTLTLDSAQVEKLVLALTKLHPSYDPGVRRSFSEEQAIWREFYELPPKD
jgi:hypothetical protein